MKPIEVPRFKHSSTLPTGLNSLMKRQNNLLKIKQYEKTLDAYSKMIEHPYQCSKMSMMEIIKFSNQENKQKEPKKKCKKLTVETSMIPQRSFRDVFGSFSPQAFDANKISMKNSYMINSAKANLNRIKSSKELEISLSPQHKRVINSPTKLLLRTIDESENKQGRINTQNLQSLSPSPNNWSKRRGGILLEKTETGRGCMSPSDAPKKIYNKVEGNKEFFEKIKNAPSRVSMFQKRRPKRNPCKSQYESKTIDAGVKVNRIQKQMNLHIQRAIKKTYQQENLSMAQRIYEQAGDEAYYDRIYARMQAWRKGKDEKKFIRKPMEVPEDLNEKPFDIFLGVKPEHVIVNKDTENWIDKHRHIDKLEKGDQRARSKKTIQFAKDIFLSWDDDGSGVLEEGEIIKPLLSLGLANDSDFCKQLLSSLDPKADNPEHDEYSLTLKDFIKIFNLDKATLKMISMIKDESMKTLLAEFKENLKNGQIQITTKSKLHHSSSQK